MTSRRTKTFKQLLSVDVQRQAREAYRLWANDPNHPSLRFKKVHATKPIWSVRVSRGYRAVCVVERDRAIWFWIGPHAEYERLLKR